MEGDSEVLLTERERDILRLVAAGNTNKEIADVLVLQPSTVKWHIKNLYSKLEARHRVELVLRAQTRALI